MKYENITPIYLLSFIVMSWLLNAHALDASADNSAPRPHCSVPFASITPQVDADQSDKAWNSSVAIPSLSSSLGSPVGQNVQPTEVQLLWDKDYLYVRFRCRASEIYSPYKNHDDPIYKADVVEVFIDAKGDGRQWVEIELSPYGVTLENMTTLTADLVSNSDLIIDPQIRDRDYWPNASWDMPGLRTASKIVQGAGHASLWIADFAFPAGATLHRLGLKEYLPMTLRANFLRYDYPIVDSAGTRVLCPQNWAPVIIGCPHISPAAMGYVDLLPRSSP